MTGANKAANKASQSGRAPGWLRHAGGGRDGPADPVRDRQLPADHDRAQQPPPARGQGGGARCWSPSPASTSHSSRRAPGVLVAGPHAVYHYNGTLAGGGSYTTVTCTYLGADGIDNDGDHLIDEPDEDVFEVVATGTVATSQRRVAAYLGFSPFLLPTTSALTMVNPNPTDITINGSPTAHRPQLHGDRCAGRLGQTRTGSRSRRRRRPRASRACSRPAKPRT